MICARLDTNGYLQVIDLAPNETCQYLALVEQSQITNPPDYLTYSDVFQLFGAAAALYGLAFVINIILIQFGYRKG